MKTALAKPFQNMAVSLSGGGYRATAFHLGTLSYLDNVEFQEEKLFKKVTTISTISGGTLTGVMVALYLAKGDTLDGAYQKLYKLLHQDELLKLAFNKVNNLKNWDNPTKTKNLINAFSEVYDDKFYDRATYQTLFDGDQSQLKDIIFGSTELSFGHQFRFQNNGKFGDFYINLPQEIAGNVRLADAAASSSCFPGGFEPMIMPTDYSSAADGPIVQYWKKKEAEKKDSNYQPTGIMDGGIIDNQGIEGVLLTEKRRAKSDIPYTGTYIISDVSGRTMEPYKVIDFKRNKFADFFTLRAINLIVAILTIILVGSLILIKNEPIWWTILSTVFLTIFTAWGVVFFMAKHKFMSTLHHLIGKKHAPDLFDDFGIFLRTPIYVLAYLIKVRFNSLLKIVNSVFMRRIRQEQLQGLFDDKNWNYRIKTNNIYTLEGRTYALDVGQQKEFELSPQIKASINLANSMPTTLWFSSEERKQRMLDNLIACGQFTCCRNLIRYIERMKKRSVWNELSEPEREEIHQLDGKLRTDLARFIETPLWLVEENKVVTQA